MEKNLNKWNVGIIALVLIALSVTTFNQEGSAMAHEGEGGYLSDKETVEKVYSFLQAGQVDSVVAYLKGLGDDKAVIQAWINVQCDINSIKHDPRTSAVLGRAGVEYSLGRGYKLPAAIMLHNISAFLMPAFDEGVDHDDVATILDAAGRQVELRREIGQEGPLMWALWDLGVAKLAAGDAVEAIRVLEEAELVALKANDDNGAAWCRIFIGKAKVRYLPGQRSEGEAEMRLAALKIVSSGEEWEKESVGQILGSVGLSQ